MVTNTNGTTGANNPQPIRSQQARRVDPDIANIQRLLASAGCAVQAFIVGVGRRLKALQAQYNMGRPAQQNPNSNTVENRNTNGVTAHSPNIEQAMDIALSKIDPNTENGKKARERLYRYGLTEEEAIKILRNPNLTAGDILQITGIHPPATSAPTG